MTVNMCKPADSAVEAMKMENDQQMVKHVLNLKKWALCQCISHKRKEQRQRMPKEQKKPETLQQQV